MKIKRIHIHNWRSIKDVEIDFQRLMVFIGQNNHGKSNVLSAILFFFGVIPVGELDYAAGANDLYVDIIFDDLDAHDKVQFNKYLTAEGRIRVRKQILDKGGVAEYRGYCEIPQDDWLKEERVSDYANREAISATPLKDFVPAGGRITMALVKKAQLDYRTQNIESVSVSYNVEATPFLGLKNVAQGIFGQVFFVPAVKNATEEFSSKGKSIFGQLLTNVINEMSSGNETYRQVKQSVKALTEKLNKKIADGSPNSERPEQISELERLLESELQSWNTTINIEITPPDVDDVMRLGTNVWVDDGVPTDVNRKGHGLQRSLIFALIKSWAKVLKEQRERDAEATAEGEGPDGTVVRKVSESTFFIFEEPELYLHPQAQRELYASLKQLSENGNQVLLSTHSSSFVDIDAYKSICIVYKNNVEDGTKRRQCGTELFAAEEDKRKFNMGYWINPDRGELFFAKKVILVEGQTEKVVVTYLAKALGVYKYEYSVIDCGSKNSIPQYCSLLNKFGIPYVVVYDKDHHSGKSPEKLAEADRSAEAITNSIDSQFGKTVVMNNDIEEELGLPSGLCRSKPYEALEQVTATGFSLSASCEAKIKTVYS